MGREKNVANAVHHMDRIAHPGVHATRQSLVPRHTETTHSKNARHVRCWMEPVYIVSSFDFTYFIQQFSFSTSYD